MPTVSIVTPTYRRAQYLRRMIESVTAQTFDDWELIVVIDGLLDDETAELLAEHRPRLGDRLVQLQQKHQGCCVARNTGIDAARGRFVAFLDSDDEFLPVKLERQLELFDRRPDLGLVYSDFSYIDLDGRFHQSVFDTKRPLARAVPSKTVGPNLHVCAPDLFEFLIRGYFIATIVGLVRREVLADDIRFLPRQEYSAEWLFYLEIARRARAGYVDELLCLHHWTAGSQTRTSAIRNTIYRRRLLQEMQRRFADASPHACREMQRHLADTCEQLGMQSYKHAEYRAAVRYFFEGLRARFDVANGVRLVQSAGRWLAACGHPGNAPQLRLDLWGP